MEKWITEVIDECYTCKKEIDVNFNMQCKKCFDEGLVECYDCSAVDDYREMNDIEDGDYRCNDCHQPTCMNCNEEVEEVVDGVQKNVMMNILVNNN